MSITKKTLLFTLVFSVLLLPESLSFASEQYTVGTILTTTSFRFNNENWFTAPHPKIATFTINTDGSAYGLTETNVPFSQYNIPNIYGIRIQRFEIQDHYHYIVDGRIAYTSEELSIELARALTQETT